MQSDAATIPESALQRLQGEWRLVEVWDIDDEDSAVGFSAVGEMVIDGDSWRSSIRMLVIDSKSGAIVERPTVSARGTLKIGVDGDSKSIDLKVSGQDAVLQGIFRLEGDRFERALAKDGANRPSEFGTSPQVYSIWERTHQVEPVAGNGDQ